MRKLRFLDTNILLYSISKDPSEASKQALAIELLANDNNALSVQVLQEFYVQATRPSRKDALTHALAAGLIQTWLRFRVQDVTLSILQEGLRIKLAYGFSYWDSAIIAAAIAMGCHELCSEDLADGRIIEGVTICNPFRVSQSPEKST